MNTKFLILLILFACSGSEVSETYVENGIAINGYDPVAYFTQSAAVEGSEQYSFNWNNATWYFSSEQNLTTFKDNPDKYSPVFGGYCAYGMSNGEGYKATTDPNAWTIVDGKLYLNYSLKVKEKWLENQDERIEHAWENWPRVKNNEEVKR